MANTGKTEFIYWNRTGDKPLSDLLLIWIWDVIYCQTTNMICASVGNKIVDHSDVVVASPIATALTTSSFST